MDIVHTFTTCTYEYRARVEQDLTPSDPWKDWGPQIVAREIYSSYREPFNVSSGEHDQEERETYFYEEVWRDHGQKCIVVLKLSEALAKYKDAMTGWDFIDGKNVRKPTVGHPGRYALVQWCKAQVEWAEELARQYSEGDVYGFILERKPLDDETNNWEEVDSCWGFYGYDWKTNGMADHISEENYQKSDLEEMNKAEQKEIDTMARFLVGSI